MCCPALHPADQPLLCCPAAAAPAIHTWAAYAAAHSAEPKASAAQAKPTLWWGERVGQGGEGRGGLGRREGNCDKSGTIPTLHACPRLNSTSSLHAILVQAPRPDCAALRLQPTKSCRAHLCQSNSASLVQTHRKANTAPTARHCSTSNRVPQASVPPITARLGSWARAYCRGGRGGGRLWIAVQRAVPGDADGVAGEQW